VEKKALENEEDRKQKKTEKTPSHARWVIRVFLIAVALSASMSLCSGAVLEDAGYVTATLILLLFIALGIMFDIIGVAVTAANPKPFNSMAAHRVKGAKEALYLIRNAEKVASFCNDVVGDICGIVSGSATVIVVLLQNSFGWRSIVVSTVVTALISGLTIGGKAIGKKVAMKKSKDVIYLTAKVLSVLHLVR
jgi:CBS domain containing-hemolysin-like protein